MTRIVVGEYINLFDNNNPSVIIQIYTVVFIFLINIV